MSADIQPHLLQSIAATVLSFYKVLGYPNTYVPDPLSKEKFDSANTHCREATELHGKLTDVTFANRWARAYFFSLQNTI
jgi:hypothetical protein